MSLRAGLLKRVDQLRASYWFLPAALALGGGGLAVGCTLLDGALSIQDRLDSPLYVGEPGGARAILTTIAGSMISIVSLAFSATIVALTLASSQFGSRLLYNFMRDRGNQVTLGTYVGTYVYCLIVLRAVRVHADSSFVPHVSVLVAIALALVGVGVLIYFFHHIAESMQVSHVVSNVGHELNAMIDRWMPRAGTAQDAPPHPPAGGVEDAGPSLVARRSGIVQAIDVEHLVALASEHDLVVHVVVRPGQFVLEGSPTMRVASVAALDERLVRSLTESVVLGRRRTLVQDVEFGLCQLVEIAVRALSPGTNDPHTAMSCLDQTASALKRLVEGGEIPRAHTCVEGRTCVLTSPASVASMIEAALGPIRRHGAKDVEVAAHLLDSIGSVAPHVCRDADRDALRRQADLTLEAAVASASTTDDRAHLRERHERACRELDPSNAC